MTNRRVAIRVAAVAAVTAAGISLAGPLSPPAGSVGSTYKTLNEVEPRIAINATNTPGDSVSVFRITQPGSYYLTANVQGVSGKSGIDIAASNVTIDLNGFSLVGGFGSGTLAGIRIAVASPEDITIKNGNIDRWGGAGVDLYTQSPTHVNVQNVRSHNNNGAGIRLNDGSSAIDCVADNNGGIGFDTYSGVTLVYCTANGNAGNGIDTSYTNTLTGCTAYGNSGTGINAYAGSTVTSCAAGTNAHGGISIINGYIRDCSVNSNQSFGISVAGGSEVLNNNCTATSAGTLGAGGGILVSTGRNRIEGNNCSSNAHGIEVVGPGNIILRNTCSGNNLNWSIAPNNVFGPIIDRSAPASAAVSGNSAASTLGSTDSNANFTY